MLIAGAQVSGHDGLLDVRCEDGLITAVGVSLERQRDELVISAGGAALLPGLHDHHLHLYALAALCNSLHCGPPQVNNREQLAIRLQSGEGGGWIRAVGYHDCVAGSLDRWQLDELLPDRPLRLQHRSGKMWMLNSRAVELLELGAHADLPGVECDATGRPNGRLVRLDGWMREQLAAVGEAQLPDLAHTSRLLASYGVTGVTDATPTNDAATLAQLAIACERGELLQRVRVMGVDALPLPQHPQLQRGERKILLDADALPDWDNLHAVIANAHSDGRAVAVHCVTTAELVLTLAVLRATGGHPGDRIEHASQVPETLLPLLADVGARVVTQPGFVYERGDQYRADIPAAEWEELYRCGSLLTQGVRLAGSSDAPYGDPDPWLAMRAAVGRCTRSGAPLGSAEQLSPEQALALFTSAAEDAGGESRRITVGGLADLCLLDRSWEEARLRLHSADVRMSFRAGQCIYDRAASSSCGGVRNATAAA